MYNTEIKKAFMENESDLNKKVYERIFNLSENPETMYQKDIYDFNNSQLEELLYMFNTKSESTMNHHFSRIKKYINYAILQGHSVNSINPLEGRTREYVKQFVYYED